MSLFSPLLEKAIQRAERLSGLDIQYRRFETAWPKRWRIRLIANKNERYDQRITVFGDTLDEALTAFDLMEMDGDGKAI